MTRRRGPTHDHDAACSRLAAVAATRRGSPLRRAPGAAAGGRTRRAARSPSARATSRRPSGRPSRSGIVLTGSLNPYQEVEVRAQVPGVVTGMRLDRGQSVRARAAHGDHRGAGHSQPGRQRRRADRRRRIEPGAGPPPVRIGRDAVQARSGLGARLPDGAQPARGRRGAAGRRRARRPPARARAPRAPSSTAPIAGQISRRSVSEGEAVQPGQTLFTIVNTGHPRAGRPGAGRRGGPGARRPAGASSRSTPIPDQTVPRLRWPASIPPPTRPPARSASSSGCRTTRAPLVGGALRHRAHPDRHRTRGGGRAGRCRARQRATAASSGRVDDGARSPRGRRRSAPATRPRGVVEVTSGLARRRPPSSSARAT